MKKGVKKSKIDRIIRLFQERKLYSHLQSTAALCIELILKTGATPIDIINIQAKDINRKKKEITLHIHKKKTIGTTTHLLSQEAIDTFFYMEEKKPLSSFSIRRLQQLIKEETTRVGSLLNNPRSLRKEYLIELFRRETTPEIKETQLTSLRKRTILSSEEEKKLIERNYNSRDKALILTLLYSGIRISELLKLHSMHVKKHSIVIDANISHNHKTRTIRLPKHLSSLFPKTGFLFASNRGTQLTQRRFEQICKEVSTQLQIEELTPSIIRATAISHLSKTLSSQELLNQSGLQSNTFFTHSIIMREEASTNTTTTTVEEEFSERKYSDSDDADRFMYSRSKLRDGGDTNEE